ncbi:MAG: PAS domain-containing protein [Campylobacterota bacterium]|nr:PAS domain-containing protein [Campylobacterota bacterium]
MQNDKTDKKYDKLINSQKNTQAWLEYSPVCTKIVDLDFNLKYMSRAGIEAIGVEDITIFYDKPYPVEIYPQPYRDTWIACFKHAKDTGEIIARDIIAIANDGREIWFDSTFIPVNDDNGVLQYIIVTSENITNRIEAEKQLQELNKNLKQLVKDEVEKNREKDRQIMEQSRLAQMGEMISMIAHQWRQPLAAISSTSAGINLKAKLNKLDNDTAVALSTKINDYSQHLSNTIDDFREFFKSNKEKKEITYNECAKQS